MTLPFFSCHGLRCRVAVHGQGRRQRGVGLIEVLVAVLLLSIAFLGIAALQARSLSTNNSAMARSMATVASYSILDAMRADRAVAINGGYNTDAAMKASACPDAGPSLASVQLHDWCMTLGQTLGAVESTTGRIDCRGTQGDCTVTIEFDDSRAGTGGVNNQSVVTKGML
jgi:type IV pilus assembly protein PilV